MKCTSSLLLLLVVMCGGVPTTHATDAANTITRSSVSSGSKVSPVRPWRLDDDFAQERLIEGSPTLSPDGQALAFTRQRAWKYEKVSNSLRTGDVRSDIWIQEAPGRALRNLTNGLSDSSGAWGPQWSPDGQWLAFLSSRGGRVRLWGWQRGQAQARPLSDLNVQFTDESSSSEVCRWIDARRLQCTAHPEGEPGPPMLHRYARPMHLATEAWARAVRGDKTTASVVDSTTFRYPQLRLMQVEVDSGQSQLIARTRAPNMSDLWGKWWLSPDRQTVAVIAPDSAERSGLEAVLMRGAAEIELRRADGHPIALDQPIPQAVATSTLQYSRDGRSLAFFAYGDAPINPALLYGEEAAKDVRGDRDAPMENPAKLWVANIAQGRLQPMDLSAFDLGGQPLTLPPFAWTAAGDLLIRAVPRPIGGMARPGTSPQWHIMGRKGRARPLGTADQPLPDELQSIDEGRTFIGLRQGQIWRLDPATGTVTSLTARLQRDVGRFDPVDEPDRPRIVLTSSRPLKASAGTAVSALTDYHLLDPATGSIVPLVKPAERAALVMYENDTAIWHAHDRNGTFLWRSTVNKPAEQLVAVNTYYRQVVTGEERLLEYTTLNGEKMVARIVLPPGYRKGRRYPLVVDFDIGTTRKTNSTFTLSDPLVKLPNADENAFPAAGYIYMFTSWPSTSMDNIGRGNMLLGVNGIIPAVEQAIEAGLVDPERLFLFGASSAGYGVYGLVTQTNRFKAAVAQAGWVDQMADPLTIGFKDRYSIGPVDFPRFGAAYINRRLPVWQNADLLRRNSPLSYVDRVQTPLLIVHGDLDSVVPIEEPEKFFKALVMQRKPARFVRYWGEGHLIANPVNLRDYYQQLFTWFEDWGDIARGPDGEILWDGDTVRSRKGARAWTVEDYSRLDLFQSGGEPSR